jgi:hypothetical protein
MFMGRFVAAENGGLIAERQQVVCFEAGDGRGRGVWRRSRRGDFRVLGFDLVSRAVAGDAEPAAEAGEVHFPADIGEDLARRKPAGVARNKPTERHLRARGFGKLARRMQAMTGIVTAKTQGRTAL